MLMKHTRIVGAKYRGDAALNICRGLAPADTPNADLELIPEPWNKYDENAVAVHYRKEHIGYLPAYIAKAVAPAITPEAEVSVTVLSAGDNPEIFLEIA